MIHKYTTQVGNPLIRAKAKRVAKPSDTKIQKLIKDLTDSMRHHNLVGMAAPQIGSDQRVFVMEVRKTVYRKAHKKNLEPLWVVINPVITAHSKQTERGYEGCGSVANSNLFGLVPRFKEVTMKAVDKNGKPFTLKAKGLLARIIQHEIDHLKGKVFLDQMLETKSLMSREEYLKKVNK